jgi:hypothetical protein
MSTYIVVLHVSDEDYVIGIRIKIERHENLKDSNTRANAYFKLDLDNKLKGDLIY